MRLLQQLQLLLLLLRVLLTYLRNKVIWSQNRRHSCQGQTGNVRNSQIDYSYMLRGSVILLWILVWKKLKQTPAWRVRYRNKFEVKLGFTPVGSSKDALYVWSVIVLLESDRVFEYARRPKWSQKKLVWSRKVSSLHRSVGGDVEAVLV